MPRCSSCRNVFHRGSMWYPEEVEFDIDGPLCHNCYLKRKRRAREYDQRSRGGSGGRQSGDSQPDSESENADEDASDGGDCDG